MDLARPRALAAVSNRLPDFLGDPADVANLGDLTQLMLGTFLLYLRVSGQFHLIVGILHLFGFRLPETHNLYYLAHNFTELWRRINIYWKDFMMQVVFYPAYFKLKQLGPRPALACATAAVFLVTWVLHSYQWFWLRGGFPVALPDILFWGILGTLVVAGALRESKPGHRSRKRVSGWDWRLGVRAAGTFFTFCFLWSLWSTESVSQWLWMLGAATEVDAKASCSWSRHSGCWSSSVGGIGTRASRHDPHGSRHCCGPTCAPSCRWSCCCWLRSPRYVPGCGADRRWYRVNARHRPQRA